MQLPNPGSFREIIARDLPGGHTKKVYSLAWNSTGSRLASSSDDKTARLWTVDSHGSGRALASFAGHTDMVDDVDWDPTDENILATGSSDRTVRLWDARAGTQSLMHNTKMMNTSIRWSPCGRYIAVLGLQDNDNLIIVLDSRAFTRATRATKFQYNVDSILWAQNQFLLLGSSVHENEGSIRLVSTKNGALKQSKCIPGHTGPIHHLSIDPSRRYFASASDDSLVSIWSMKDLVCLRTITRHRTTPSAVSFSHDSTYIASCGEDRVIDVAHTETGQMAVEMDGTRCRYLAWHPNQLLLAGAVVQDSSSGRKDAWIKLWSFKEPSSGTF